MSHERPNHLSQPRPYEVFGFTKQECLDGRVNQERFQEIINDDQTPIHSVEESYNNYGDFLFVTVSRFSSRQRICMIFFGLGYHEYRERWFTEEWFWYQTPLFRQVVKQIVSKEEAYGEIQQRLETISPKVRPGTQTARGRLFEMLANLTDEDGAYAEFQKLGDLPEWLEEEIPERMFNDRSTISEEGGERMTEQLSRIVKAGAKTYFLDVKETKEGKPYLVITESRFKGEGKERERSSIAIFPEYAHEFLQALQETTELLE